MPSEAGSPDEPEARLRALAQREQLKTLNDLCALRQAAGSPPSQDEVVEP